MIKSHNRTRRAFTLVELLGVVFCTTMLTAAAVGLLHHIGAWSQSVRASTTTAAAADRLEQSLRHELQLATDVQANRALLTITTGEGTSQWQLANGACKVKWTSAEETPRHERYDIGPYSDWNVTTENGMTVVTLEPPDNERAMPLRVVEPRSDAKGGSDG